MKYVVLVAFVDPQKALGSKDVARKVLEKVLQFVEHKRQVGLERNRLESIAGEMRMIAVGVCRLRPNSIIVPVRVRMIDKVPVRLEQPDAENQGQRNPASRGSHNPGVLPDRADFFLDRVRDRWPRGRIC